jgi:hypothetical protein
LSILPSAEHVAVGCGELALKDEGASGVILAFEGQVPAVKEAAGQGESARGLSWVQRWFFPEAGKGGAGLPKGQAKFTGFAGGGFLPCTLPVAVEVGIKGEDQMVVTFRHFDRRGKGQVTRALKHDLAAAGTNPRDGQDTGLGVGFPNLGAIKPDRGHRFGGNGEGKPRRTHGEVDLDREEAPVDTDHLFCVEVLGVGEADGVLSWGDRGQREAVEWIGGTAGCAVEVDRGTGDIGQDDDGGLGEVEQSCTGKEEGKDGTEPMEPSVDGAAAREGRLFGWGGLG